MEPKEKMEISEFISIELDDKYFEIAKKGCEYCTGVETKS